MFEIFKKKKVKEIIQREQGNLLDWELPKTYKALAKIDKITENKIYGLLKEVVKKAKVENVDDEIISGIRGWVDPNSKLGYELIIYSLMNITDRLSKIEELIHSKKQSENSNQ